MGSFICKGLELISIIPSLIQLSLQIKVNQMLQSEISVPCQLLTSPVLSKHVRRSCCVFICHFPTVTWTSAPVKVFQWRREGHYWKAQVLYLYTCFVLSQLRFSFGVPRLPGALICYSSGFVKKRLCVLNCICYFHMLSFMQLESCPPKLVVCMHMCARGCVCFPLENR